MRFSLAAALVGASAALVAATPAVATSYASTVVLTTIYYTTHTVLRYTTTTSSTSTSTSCTTSTSSSVPVYTPTPTPASTTCTTLVSIKSKVPYYSAPSMSAVPLHPPVYTSAVVHGGTTYAIPTTTTPLPAPTYTGAANSLRAAGAMGAGAVVAIAAALL